MKTFNKEITKEEAKSLFNSVGATYPNTEHNKEMMKSVIDEFMFNLRSAK